MEKVYFKEKEVAKEIGVPRSTIKYWSNSINAISKYIKGSAKGGYRLYHKESIACFREIQRLSKEKRLSIKEIDAYFKQGGLTAMQGGTEVNVEEVSPTNLEQKMQIQAELEEAIKKLEELRALL